jgi:hypothetical protein
MGWCGAWGKGGMNGLASWFSFVPLPLFDLPLKSAMCRCKYVCVCMWGEGGRESGWQGAFTWHPAIN